MAKIALSVKFQGFSWKIRPLKNIFRTLENGHSIRHQSIPPLSAGQTINANFFCTKFFENSSGHARPRRKSWTSTPTSAFFCGPGDGEKLFDPRASGRKGQECPREIRAEKFMFMPFSLPRVTERLFFLGGGVFCYAGYHYGSGVRKTGWFQKRWFWWLFPCTKNRNEGTKNGSSPGTKNRNEGAFGCSPVPKNQNESAFDKKEPPFFETTLLFRLDHAHGKALARQHLCVTLRTAVPTLVFRASLFEERTLARHAMDRTAMARTVPVAVAVFRGFKHPYRLKVLG